MRLIDADKLIVEIKTCLWDWESVNGIESKTVLNQTITDIENMPSIDAVPVIRCKDCKYARMTYDGECKYCDVWFPDEAEYLDGDYYCASAERKEE